MSPSGPSSAPREGPRGTSGEATGTLERAADPSLQSCCRSLRAEALNTAAPSTALMPHRASDNVRGGAGVQVTVPEGLLGDRSSSHLGPSALHLGVRFSLRASRNP